MLSITGYEANGCPIRAESLKNLIFFLLLGIVLLHLFTKNTQYRTFMRPPHKTAVEGFLDIPVTV